MSILLNWHLCIYIVCIGTRTEIDVFNVAVYIEYIQEQFLIKKIVFLFLFPVGNSVLGLIWTIKDMEIYGV